MLKIDHDENKEFMTPRPPSSSDEMAVHVDKRGYFMLALWEYKQPFRLKIE